MSSPIGQRWCSSSGESPPPFGPLPSIQAVASGRIQAKPAWLSFPDPNNFVLGQLHQHGTFWHKILEGFPKRQEILSYIHERVDVYSFFQPFWGRVIFPNSHSCINFEAFITSTILHGVRNRSLRVLGRVGLVQPPPPGYAHFH